MRAAGRESFEAWAEARQISLVRSAYFLTGDFHRAEDLVQEALCKVAMRWDSLREGNPDAWVRTVVYRQNVSWWRQNGRVTVTDRVAETATQAPGEAAVLLRAALAGLTWNQRAVVLLRYVEDLSILETAEVLGVSEGTVKKQASVALARLRNDVPELSDLIEEGS